MYATTIVAVRRPPPSSLPGAARVVIAGDGQVSMGNTIVKSTARKVRRVADGNVVAGFAGSAADGMTLFDLFEAKLREQGGDLTRAAVKLTQEWRKDKLLRQLEALMLVADRERILLLSGTGDVLEPDGECHAIGSGGAYALAAARALCAHTQLGARDVAVESLKTAADICVYTNANVVVEELV
ncbi:MAG: ATP-dependent protease subunit HslV [Deltaproteobacteria bacterium]|nr:ATP-dependent protease subunit HslV [Deltaproteobacteria bacterium]